MNATQWSWREVLSFPCFNKATEVQGIAEIYPGLSYLQPKLWSSILYCHLYCRMFLFLSLGSPGFCLVEQIY